MSIYSKKSITKNIDGRRYELKKLGAKEVSIESFKIVKAVTPSIGVGFDSMQGNSIFDITSTTASALQFLSDNLTVEHYTELVDKLLGSLRVDDVSVGEWDEHFDEYPEDFLEIVFWSFKENFFSFFMNSTILKPWISKAKEMVLPQMKNLMNDALKLQEQESKEE